MGKIPGHSYLKIKKRVLTLISSSLLTLSALISYSTTAFSSPLTPNSDWPQIGYDGRNSNNNTAELLITKDTAPFLKQLWQIEPVLPAALFGGNLGPNSSAIIKNEVLYVSELFGGIRSFNARTGAPIAANLVNCPAFSLVLGQFYCDIVQRASVIHDDFLFTHSLGFFAAPASLLAVSNLSDLSNANIISSSQIPFSPYPFVTEPNQESVLSDMALVEDIMINGELKTLLIASAASDAQRYARGRMFAYDITDPFNITQLWETFTTSDTANETCPAYAQAAGSWSTPAVDKALGLVYFGIGNPELTVADQRELNGCTDPNQIDTPASQKDLRNSLVALDIRTGEVIAQNRFSEIDLYNQSRDPEIFIRGHYRRGPNSSFPVDVDVSGYATLIDLTDDNEVQRLVGMGDKAGRYKIMNRQTLETVYEFDIGINAIDYGGISTSGAVVDGDSLYVGMTSTDTPDNPMDWAQLYQELVGQPIPAMGSPEMRNMVAGYVNGRNPGVNFDSLSPERQAFFLEQFSIDPNRPPRANGGPYGTGSPGGLDYMDVWFGLIASGQSTIPLEQFIPVLRLAKIDLDDGEIEWIIELNTGTTFSPLIYTNGVLFVGGRNGLVHAVDGDSGEVITEMSGAELADIYAISMAGGKIYATAPSGVQAFGLTANIKSEAAPPKQYSANSEAISLIDDAKIKNPFGNQFAGVLLEIKISNSANGDTLSFADDGKLLLSGNELKFNGKTIATAISMTADRILLELTDKANRKRVAKIIKQSRFHSTAHTTGSRTVEYRLSTVDQILPLSPGASREIHLQ